MGTWMGGHMQVCVALLTVLIASGLRVCGFPMDEVRWLVSPLLFVIGGTAFADVAAWKNSKTQQ